MRNRRIFGGTWGTGESADNIEVNIHPGYACTLSPTDASGKDGHIIVHLAFRP